MLSFDYAPASFFNSDCFMRSPMLDSNILLEHQNHYPLYHHHQQQQPRRIVRSKSYQPRRPTQEDYFASLLNQLIEHSGEEQKPLKPEVEAKVLNARDSFQIQVFKDNNNFNHYSIRYKLSGHDVIIYIESEVDDFAKGFRFAQDKIDINNVEWKVVRNVLVINVPKCKDEFILRPSVRFVKRVDPPACNNKPMVQQPKQAPVLISKPQRESTSTPPKEAPAVETRSSSPQEKLVTGASSPVTTSTVSSKPSPAPKSKVISIPIEFADSETEITPKSTRESSRRSSVTESVKSNTRTESEAELSDDDSAPSNKLPKLKRKVSIEEVEDESLHMADLD
ncbi:hypothetical protein WICANDRAFT_63482 [Wickerhamomyces anomalus NRRL Y-366-8]|uniref:Uncharacterized protein n=1 Tax=Wickerhamomyces anomalus (strain ATCC 58044 / CBS 1984 / NCYC 433 / NRRL Y-366-8) TaxID=683960 RepID=A0A1E3P0I8_WICAA|nr:uncharacterized protein WICANDRAFT_63482 [Wickerhamomyces anomalus NRRL Y-366-8]ODQ58979.1 hypothetical protein WICANDRAFT_63482 [Wickerhamomyces anomalus NRRL Y-366-8]